MLSSPPTRIKYFKPSGVVSGQTHKRFLSFLPKMKLIHGPPTHLLGFGAVTCGIISVVSMIPDSTQNEMGHLERKASSHYDHHFFR